MPVQVDDMFMCSNSDSLCDELLQYLRTGCQLQLKDLGIISSSMGMEFEADFETGFIHMTMESQLRGLVEGAGLNLCNTKLMPLPIGAKPSPRDAPLLQDDIEARQGVKGEYRTHLGKLIYIARCLLYPLCFPASILGQRQNEPKKQDYLNLKHVLRYCANNIRTRLTYTRKDYKEAHHVVYGDADLDTGACQASYVEFLFGNPVAWRSSKTAHASTSTRHGETMACDAACREAMGTKNILVEISGRLGPNPFFQVQTPIVVTDNQPYWMIVTGRVGHHEETKHLRRRYMYCAQLFRFGEVAFAWVPGDDMFANQGTKSDLFKFFKRQTPVCLGHEHDPATRGELQHVARSTVADVAHADFDPPPPEVWLVRGKYHHVDCPIKPDPDVHVLVSHSMAVATDHTITCSCKTLFMNPRRQ
jgi:hypothetical protein